MKCPNCGETLLMAERHKVEIDYCPNCRGVWLDKGELDKILEYAEAQASQPSQPEEPQQPQYPQQPYYSDKPYDKDKHYDPHYHKKHKRKSFLGDFFDFD